MSLAPEVLSGVLIASGFPTYIQSTDPQHILKIRTLMDEAGGTAKPTSLLIDWGDGTRGPVRVFARYDSHGTAHNAIAYSSQPAITLALARVTDAYALVAVSKVKVYHACPFLSDDTSIVLHAFATATSEECQQESALLRSLQPQWNDAKQMLSQEEENASELGDQIRQATDHMAATAAELAGLRDLEGKASKMLEAQGVPKWWDPREAVDEHTLQNVRKREKKSLEDGKDTYAACLRHKDEQAEELAERKGCLVRLKSEALGMLEAEGTRYV